jgi:hypothetical protein
MKKKLRSICGVEETKMKKKKKEGIFEGMQLLISTVVVKRREG